MGSTFLIIAILSACGSKEAIKEAEEISTPNYLTIEHTADIVDNHLYPAASLPLGWIQVAPVTSSGVTTSDYVNSDSIFYGFAFKNGINRPNEHLFNLRVVPGIDTVAGGGLNTKGEVFSHKKELSRPGFYGIQLPKSELKLETGTTANGTIHRFEKTGSKLIELQILATEDVNLDVNKVTFSGDSMVIIERTQASNNTKLFYAIHWSEKPDRRLSTSEIDTLSVSNFQRSSFNIQLSWGGQHKTITLKTGISRNSTAEAICRLKEELLRKKFLEIIGESRATWEKELSKISIRNTDERIISFFYTQLYRSYLTPLHDRLDLTSVPDSVGSAFYSRILSEIPELNWQLLNLLNPKETAFFADQLHEEIKRWPWNAYAANIEGDLPLLLHLQYEKKLATPLKISEINRVIKNRPGAALIDKYGFIPAASMEGLLSRGVQYGREDRLISLIYQNKADTLFERQYFNLAKKSYGVKKFDGTFRDFYSVGESNRTFDKGTLNQHLFDIWDDNDLISAYQNKLGLETALDQYFKSSENSLLGLLDFNIKSNQSYPYLYHIAGASEKADKMVYSLLNMLKGPSGQNLNNYPSWWVWSSIGLFPSPNAINYYFIGVPYFDLVEFQFESSTVLTITRDLNFSNTREVLYNGEQSSSSVSKSQLIKGGTILVKSPI